MSSDLTLPGLVQTDPVQLPSVAAPASPLAAGYREVAARPSVVQRVAESAITTSAMVGGMWMALAAMQEESQTAAAFPTVARYVQDAYRLPVDDANMVQVPRAQSGPLPAGSHAEPVRTSAKPALPKRLRLDV